MRPPVDTQTEKEILRKLQEKAETLGFKLEKDSLSNTLFILYAQMLGETRERLNRAPDKHRLAFLNLQQQPRHPARPAEAFAVFEVVNGREEAVAVPAGTMLRAENDVLFRTKWDFDAVSSEITDVYWVDRAQDAAVPLELPCHFSETECKTGKVQHMAEFQFFNVFYSTGSPVYLTAHLEMDNQKLPLELLAYPQYFKWSLHLDLEDEENNIPVTALKMDDDTLCLSYPPFSPCQSVWLQISIYDTRLLDVSIRELCVFLQYKEESPVWVSCEGQIQESQAFYPFGKPLKGAAECYIFCQDKLFHPHAELTMEFDLLVEETVELPPKPPEIEWKWIMREPKPEPEPEIALACAQVVRWEYWNGGAYREISAKQGKVNDFSKGKIGLRLVFDCPEDIQKEEIGGETGYFLHLSSGFCEELYKLPRAVRTPKIQNLRFSCCSLFKVTPVQAYAENFGDRKEIQLNSAPFYPAPYEKALCIGFNQLPANACLQLLFHITGKESEDKPYLTVEMMSDSKLLKLHTDDGTRGFTRSGLLIFRVPQKPEKEFLFGKQRYWIRIPVLDALPETRFCNIYINGQKAYNRIRCRQYYSFLDLPRNGVLRLPETNLITAWVFIRTPEGEWERWLEYTPAEGVFRLGYYKLDYQNGILELPTQLIARAVSKPGEDFLGITYDICNGISGNVPVGTINELEQDAPFIKSVTNPLPATNGEDSETDSTYAGRLEHALYHNGNAVSVRDYELIARDMFPVLHDVKCIAGRPIRLFLLLPEGKDFVQIRYALGKEFSRIGCAAAAGTSVHILNAVRVPLNCTIEVSANWHIFTSTFRRLKETLETYLDPLTGGADGKGWRIGTLPSYEQIYAFIKAQFPLFKRLHLTITADGGGCHGDLREMKAGAGNVPCPGVIKMEEANNA